MEENSTATLPEVGDVSFKHAEEKTGGISKNQKLPQKQISQIQMR